MPQGGRADVKAASAWSPQHTELYERIAAMVEAYDPDREFVVLIDFGVGGQSFALRVQADGRA